MRIIVTVSALLILGAGAIAQPKPWRIGEDGLSTWREHTKQKCVECRGKKRVKCHVCRPGKKNLKPCLWCSNSFKKTCQQCAGSGKSIDPMTMVRCSSCKDWGGIGCSLCRGSGLVRFAGGGKKGTKCPGCKGDGGYPCGLCHGKRWVSVARPKGAKDVRKGKLETLETLLEEMDETIKALKRFNPKGLDKKSGPPAWAKTTKAMAKAIPEVRKSQKALKDALTTVSGASRVTSPTANHETRVRTLLGVYAAGLAKILEEQRKVVAVALDAKRHDAKVIAERKNKK